MTKLPRLYPGHQHQWTDADPELFTNSLVRCTVCGFQAPRNAAGLDGQMAPLTEQVYDASGCNVTPTDPGYCEFYDQFGAHAYTGGRSGGDPAREHEEGWTTCCDVDTEGHPPEQETRTDA